MAKRRGSGEGTIHQLPSGSWRAQVTVDGKRLGHTAPTRKAAQEWLKKTVGQIDQGLTYEGTRTTVEAFLAGWLVSARSTLRPRTHQSYSQIVRDHITPYIGKIKIAALRPDQVQAMYDRKITEGASARMVELTHSVLHRALNHALRLGMVMRNVCDAATPPRPERHEIVPLAEAEVGRLLAAVEGHPLKAIIYLAVLTGMREGEILGLQWGDLDWQSGRLQVRRQVQYVKGQGLVFSPPKTASGRRVLQVGAQMLEMLHEQFERVNLMRAAAGEKWHAVDLIFPAMNGRPRWAANFQKDWHKIAAAAGLPPTRFHDLRHLAASIFLVRLRRPPTEVSRLLGHRGTMMTLDVYGHMLDGLSAQTAAEMEELIFPVRVDAHARTQKD